MALIVTKQDEATFSCTLKHLDPKTQKDLLIIMSSCFSKIKIFYLYMPLP